MGVCVYILVYVCVRDRERERKREAFDQTKQFCPAYMHTNVQSLYSSEAQCGEETVALEASIKAVVPAAGLWETTLGNSFD